MTLSFANIQVRAAEQTASASRESILETAAAMPAAREGWERVDEADRADRSLLVGPVHGGEWVGVYLDRADRFEEVESFGGVLSAELATAAVGFRVDGGTARMSLGRDGERVGSVMRRDGAVEGAYSEEWAAPLPAGGDEEALRRLFEETATAPDAWVREVAEQYGMEPQLVAASYRYVRLNVAGSVDAFHYRRVESNDTIGRVGGAPQFDVPDRVRELETSVGEQVQASTSIGNRGGAVTGVRAVVDGTALDREIVEIDTVRLTGGRGQQAVEREGRVEEDGEGGRRIVAEFDEVEVAGALSEDVDLSDVSDERGREIMRAHRASRMSIYARGRAVAAGEGTLAVGVEASNDAGSDAARVRSELEVHPEPRMPRGARSEHAPTHTLRQMEKSGTLFALVHFDTPMGAWKSLAADAMSRWASEISGSDDQFATVELSDPRSRPDEQVTTAEAFTDAERMADRVGRVGDVYQWSAVLYPGSGGDDRLEPEETGGVSYFSCEGPESDAGAEPAPALGFWVSIEERSEDEIRELEELLRELVDAFARSGRMIQALMARWSWAPALRLRTLPYEIVCGLDSSGHLRVEWLNQYLRAAAPEIWVAPELWERLDPAAAGEAAAVETLGEARRLTLRDDASLKDLEAALAPVLPGAEEWSKESS